MPDVDTTEVAVVVVDMLIGVVDELKHEHAELTLVTSIEHADAANVGIAVTAVVEPWVNVEQKD